MASSLLVDKVSRFIVLDLAKIVICRKSSGQQKTLVSNPLPLMLAWGMVGRVEIALSEQMKTLSLILLCALAGLCYVF